MMMTTVNEVNNNKTKVLDEFFFIVFRSFVFAAELDV